MRSAADTSKAAGLVDRIISTLCNAGLDFNHRRGVYLRTIGHGSLSSMRLSELEELAAEADRIAAERRERRS